MTKNNPLMLEAKPSNPYRLKLEASLSNRFFKQSILNRITSTQEIVSKDVSRIIGQHLLAEFDIGKRSFSKEVLQKAVTCAASISGATILNVFFFNTSYGGVSGVVVIAESHFIIHSFPSGYLALDIYTCGNRINLDLALQVITDALGCAPYDTARFKRGVMASTRNGNDVHLQGIADARQTSLRFYQQQKRSNIFCAQAEARHFVIEHYGSHPSILTNGEKLKTCFSGAFGNDFRHKLVQEFPPKGIGGASLVLIGEGIHATTHPWPELLGYTPIDVFACRQLSLEIDQKIKRVTENLSQYFGKAKTDIQFFPRGVRKNGQLQPVFSKMVPADQLNPSSVALRR